MEICRDSELSIQFDMPVEFLHADPRVSADVGKVAIKRGPIVYCLEEVDNGAELQCIYLSGKAAQKKKSTYFSECLELELQGRRLIPRNGELYSSAGLTYEDAVVRAIPYAYWNNRGEGRCWSGYMNDRKLNYTSSGIKICKICIIYLMRYIYAINH